MIPEPGAWTTMTAVDEEMVRRKRKLVSKMVCDDSLRYFEPKTIEYMNTFCKVLEEGATELSWSDPKDLTTECRKLMTAIISGFAFGQKIDVFANPDQSFILDALENYAWRMGIYKESPFLTYLQLEKAYAILSRGNTTKKWLRWGETYISGVLSSCKDVETGTFSAFVNSKSTITGEACTRGELSSEAFFLMLAGSDTSATTASAVLFYLANHPDIYARLAMEIRTMYSSLAEIQSSGSRSTYLNACIMETLRLSPATISAPWRDVQRGGALIDEELIPEGYEVGTCIYAIHHDKSSFPHPHTFIPSRWLPEDPLHDILFTLPSTDPLSKTNLLSPTTPETQQLAMSPFGIGLRRCPGRSMALRNLHLLIARIIWQYDFRAAEGALGRVGRGEEAKGWKNWGRHREREFQLKATITSMSVGPWLVFRKRKNEVSE
ncbi:MAG: hypothetical protein MMC33_006024 [Icmadophila ericetorum]|nr:hypothetical protein [Icmadophila ericetorum]